MNPPSSIAVDDLLAELAAAIYDRQLGWLAVTGTLSDWHRHRYGSGSGELTVGHPPTARLRLHANRHAAAAIDCGFGAVGYDPTTPAAATAHGQVLLHPCWGLQLDTTTITLHRVADVVATRSDPSAGERYAGGDAARRWPPRVDTIGLVAPVDGDDARTDVLVTLDDLDLTVIEHRVPMTGPEAIWRVTRAFDQLADDSRPDVTVVVRGGGPDADLAVFNHPAVAAAVARHPRPVITGIGHATNHTAADRVAWLSCITPTAAAAVIAHHHRQQSTQSSTEPRRGH
jgi:exodeoxyribonuclease VII large subunit